MKYTSLTHNTRGYNTQLDFTSEDNWKDYCLRNKDVVWSKLYEARSGILVKAYWPDEFEEYRGESK